MGFGHQAAADGHHLLLATGEGAGLLLQAFSHPREVVADFLQVAVPVGARAAAEGAHLQVFQHGHVAEQLAAFRHHHHTQLRLAVGGKPSDVLAFENDLAAAGAHPAGNAAQGGGLAGPVGADDGGQMAAGDLQGGAPEHLDFTVAGLEIFHFAE